MDVTDRYSRQLLFPPLGGDGQERLLRAFVAVVGCGALGTNIVNLLARAGVGFLRVIDRDVVELSNLHRQVLFDEEDARQGAPKAEAAKKHIKRINSTIEVDARVVDLVPRNIGRLLEGADLILDGTDNVETRYLINDHAVKNRIPWIYGGAVGSTAACMTIVPQGPCLRCLWPVPPPPGSLPTCDTAGVLPSAPALAASLQAAAAMRLLAGKGHESLFIEMDVWDAQHAAIKLVKDPNCLTCAQGRYEFLDAKASSWTTNLCGRSSVQVTPAREMLLDLETLAGRISRVGRVQKKGYYLEALVGEDALLIFPDGRVIVKNTTDTARARTIAAKYVGF